MWEALIQMSGSLDMENAFFPPTLFYNEGWLLRFVLAAMDGGDVSQPFTFHPNARWFSEGMLTSPFLPRKGSVSNGLAESRTRADGVVGHFQITPNTKTGLELTKDATQFVVCEAKLYSLLRAEVKNAPGYDQAARSVACMAASLADKFTAGEWTGVGLGFYLMAPRDQIRQKLFDAEVNHESIAKKISERIEAYRTVDVPRFNELLRWQHEYVGEVPTRVELRCITWEDVIDSIAQSHPEKAVWLRAFYDRCRTENRPPEGAPGVPVGGKPVKGQIFEVGTDGGPVRVRVLSGGGKTAKSSKWMNATVCLSQSRTFIYKGRPKSRQRITFGNRLGG